jgi:hypothetical protein
MATVNSITAEKFDATLHTQRDAAASVTSRLPDQQNMEATTNQSSSMSRRAVMNAIVSASTVATAAPVAFARCIAPGDADPIYAAIESHRFAHAEWMRTIGEQDALEGQLDLPLAEQKQHPRWIEFMRRVEVANERMELTSEALTDVRPTTMAGVIALLDYIDGFNRGEARGSSAYSYSEYYHWPDDLGDESLTNGRGNPLVMPFPYWVMRNVLAGLRSLP